jgi:hypothetical protein
MSLPVLLGDIAGTRMEMVLTLAVQSFKFDDSYRVVSGVAPSSWKTAVSRGDIDLWLRKTCLDCDHIFYDLVGKRFETGY